MPGFSPDEDRCALGGALSSTSSAPWLLAALALVLVAGPARAAFTDVTSLYGIAAGDSMSYTASFQDYDGDGDQDFLVNNHWKNGTRFYRNEGSTPWVDVGSFLGTGNADRHDALWGDFDNSGSPDLYMIRGNGQDNDFFWNEGGGVMVEEAAAAGVTDNTGRGREITFSDFDNDGWLDIFLVNDFLAGFKKPSVLFLNNGDRTFTAFPNTSNLFFSRLHVSSIDYDLDGDADLTMSNPPWAPGELWRNDGGLNFTEILTTAFAGIPDPLLQANGLSWADYDNDGDPDLLACGGNRSVWDFAALEADSLRWYAECAPGEERRLEFVTEGDSITVMVGSSTYAPVTCIFGTAPDSVAGFPVTLAVAEIAGEPPGHLAGTGGFYVWSTPAAVGDSVHVSVLQDSSAPSERILGGDVRANGPGIGAWQKIGYPSPPGYVSGNFTNRLYRNEGDGTFSEVTQTAFSVNDSTVSSLGAAWGDYDCDGWIDVYVTNSGNIETRNEPNYLYRNNGDGTFTEVAAVEALEGSDRGMGDGAAWADVDGDGFLDLYVDNGAETPPFGVGPRELFSNPGNANHWLQVDVRGLNGNASAIGARVRVVTPSGTQWRTIQGDSDNCFSGSHTIHFGLGAHDHADSLQVLWPWEGAPSTYTNVVADARYTLIEGKPLRANDNAHFICLQDKVMDTVMEGELTTWEVSVDNFAARASVFGARYESCSGAPITWLSIDPDTGGVWPGGAGSFAVTADASALPLGAHCGFVIFESNSFLGPDTLRVNLDVVPDVTAAPTILSGIPAVLSLGPLRPNPARGEVHTALGLPAEARAAAAVYSVAGRRVATLLDADLPAGWHPLTWNGRDGSGRPVAAGVYLLRLEAAGERVTRKIVRLD